MRYDPSELAAIAVIPLQAQVMQKRVETLSFWFYDWSEGSLFDLNILLSYYGILWYFRYCMLTITKKKNK